jgi:hypothetical protein
MWDVFHSRTAQALGSWLGILATVFTVLSKLSPAWVGTLTWPEAILLGIAMALATSLLAAIATAIFAVGFRLIRPLPKSLPANPIAPDPLRVVVQEAGERAQAGVGEAMRAHARIDLLERELEQQKEETGRLYSAADEARMSGSGAIQKLFDVERLAYFIAVVEGVSAAGISPGFGRVTDEDEESFTISLTICNSNVERMKRDHPEMLAEGARIRKLNPLPASAIEAGTGETTQIGSTEGESAVPSGETPDPSLTPSKESDNA